MREVQKGKELILSHFVRILSYPNNIPSILYLTCSLDVYPCKSILITDMLV